MTIPLSPSPIVLDSRSLAVAIIKWFESCRLVAYLDTGGVWTIGYGHTHGVKQGDTCTQQQANEWLIEDLGIAESAVRDVSLAVKGSIPVGTQLAALTSFTFNVGEGGLRKLLSHSNVVWQLGLWIHDNGKVVDGLVHRRLVEAFVYSLGGT